MFKHLKGHRNSFQPNIINIQKCIFYFPEIQSNIIVYSAPDIIIYFNVSNNTYPRPTICLNASKFPE